MHVFIHICMHSLIHNFIYTYIFMCTSIPIHRFACTHINTHTYINAHTYAHTHTHTQVLVKGATEIRNTRTGSAVANPVDPTAPEASEVVTTGGTQPRPKPVAAGKTVQRVTLASGKTVDVPTNSQRTGSRAPAPSSSECVLCFVRRGERRPLRAAAAAAAGACD